VAEAALKMAAAGLVGPRGYWRQGMCALEGAVAVLGVVDVVLDALPGAPVGALTLRMLRVSRMLRLFSLLRFYPEAWVLLQALVGAIPQAAGALLLLLLFTLFFALLGQQLFAPVYPLTTQAPPFLNFLSLSYGMLAVFQVMCVRGRGPSAPPLLAWRPAPPHNLVFMHLPPFFPFPETMRTGTT
jgi:hypothetical protein